MAEPQPELTFFAGSAFPREDGRSRRVDLVADLDNPTAEALKGCFLEVVLTSGVRATLEFGDLGPREGGSAWKPLSLVDPVGPEAFLQAPATVVSPPGKATLPECWLLASLDAVTLGYTRGEKRVERDLTEQFARQLPEWNQAEADRLRSWERSTGAASEPSPQP